MIDIAAEMADRGAFIVPQQSAPFRYSGTQCYERKGDGRGVEFERLTGFDLTGGVGIDTALYKDEWKDTSIICEIVCSEFTEARERQAEERARLAALPLPLGPVRPAEQLAFL